MIIMDKQIVIKIQQIQKEIEKEIKSRNFYFNVKTDKDDNVIYFVSKNTSSLISKICSTITVTSIVGTTDVNIDFIIKVGNRVKYESNFIARDLWQKENILVVNTSNFLRYVSKMKMAVLDTYIALDEFIVTCKKSDLDYNDFITVK